MKRRSLKAVTVALDRDRTLIYDLNAICSFEEATGQSVVAALRDLSMRNIRALIWAGLRADDPAITLEQVGAMITFSDIPGLTGALRSALNSDSSTDDAAAAGAVRPTQPTAEAANGASTGAVSGLSDDSISDLQTVNSGG